MKEFIRENKIKIIIGSIIALFTLVIGLSIADAIIRKDQKQAIAQEPIKANTYVQVAYRYLKITNQVKKPIEEWDTGIDVVELGKIKDDFYVINLDTGDSENLNGFEIVKVCFKLPGSMLGDLNIYLKENDHTVFGQVPGD